MTQVTYIAVNGFKYEINEALDGSWFWCCGNADHGNFKTIEAAIASAKKHAEDSPKSTLLPVLVEHARQMKRLDRQEQEVDGILRDSFWQPMGMNEHKAAREILKLYGKRKDFDLVEQMAAVIRTHIYEPWCDECKRQVMDLASTAAGAQAA